MSELGNMGVDFSQSNEFVVPELLARAYGFVYDVFALGHAETSSEGHRFTINPENGAVTFPPLPVALQESFENAIEDVRLSYGNGILEEDLFPSFIAQNAPQDLWNSYKKQSDFFVSGLARIEYDFDGRNLIASQKRFLTDMLVPKLQSIRGLDASYHDDVLDITARSPAEKLELMAYLEALSQKVKQKGNLNTSVVAKDLKDGFAYNRILQAGARSATAKKAVQAHKRVVMDGAAYQGLAQYLYDKDKNVFQALSMYAAQARAVKVEKGYALELHLPQTIRGEKDHKKVYEAIDKAVELHKHQRVVTAKDFVSIIKKETGVGQETPSGVERVLYEPAPALKEAYDHIEYIAQAYDVHLRHISGSIQVEAHDSNIRDWVKDALKQAQIAYTNQTLDENLGRILAGLSLGLKTESLNKEPYNFSIKASSFSGLEEYQDAAYQTFSRKLNQRFPSLHTKKSDACIEVSVADIRDQHAIEGAARGFIDMISEALEEKKELAEGAVAALCVNAFDEVATQENLALSETVISEIVNADAASGGEETEDQKVGATRQRTLAASVGQAYGRRSPLDQLKTELDPAIEGQVSDLISMHQKEPVLVIQSKSFLFTERYKQEAYDSFTEQLVRRYPHLEIDKSDEETTIVVPELADKKVIRKALSRYMDVLSAAVNEKKVLTGRDLSALCTDALSEVSRNISSPRYERISDDLQGRVVYQYSEKLSDSRRADLHACFKNLEKSFPVYVEFKKESQGSFSIYAGQNSLEALLKKRPEVQQAVRQETKEVLNVIEGQLDSFSKALERNEAGILRLFGTHVLAHSGKERSVSYHQSLQLVRPLNHSDGDRIVNHRIVYPDLDKVSASVDELKGLVKNRKLVAACSGALEQVYDVRLETVGDENDGKLKLSFPVFDTRNGGPGGADSLLENMVIKTISDVSIILSEDSKPDPKLYADLILEKMRQNVKEEHAQRRAENKSAALTEKEELGLARLEGRAEDKNITDDDIFEVIQSYMHPYGSDVDYSREMIVEDVAEALGVGYSAIQLQAALNVRLQSMAEDQRYGRYFTLNDRNRIQQALPFNGEVTLVAYEEHDGKFCVRPRSKDWNEKLYGVSPKFFLKGLEKSMYSPRHGEALSDVISSVQTFPTEERSATYHIEMKPKPKPLPVRSDKIPVLKGDPYAGMMEDEEGGALAHDIMQDKPEGVSAREWLSKNSQKLDESSALKPPLERNMAKREQASMEQALRDQEKQALEQKAIEDGKARAAAWKEEQEKKKRERLASEKEAPSTQAETPPQPEKAAKQPSAKSDGLIHSVEEFKSALQEQFAEKVDGGQLSFSEEGGKLTVYAPSQNRGTLMGVFANVNRDRAEDLDFSISWNFD